MIILDTNVLSELMKPRGSDAVLHWVDGRSDRLFTTCVTEAEIRFGLNLLADGRRREMLLSLADEMFEQRFADRVLSFDRSAAQAFAEIAAERRRAGRPIALADAQIAAIALSRRMAVATRNIADFAGCGVDLHDPWEG